MDRVSAETVGPEVCREKESAFVATVMLHANRDEHQKTIDLS